MTEINRPVRVKYDGTELIGYLINLYFKDFPEMIKESRDIQGNDKVIFTILTTDGLRTVETESSISIFNVGESDGTFNPLTVVG